MMAVCSILSSFGEAFLAPRPHVSAEILIVRCTDDIVSVVSLLLLLQCERSNRKERAFIVYGIGLEGFDNRTKCMSEYFQSSV